MAEALIRRRHLFFGALLCLAQLCAHAQSLQDPTRPPVASGVGSDGRPFAEIGPQLQSVLIATHPGGRHVAVIDGDTVRLGDRYKGARVARISQGEVELVRGRERQVLRLPRPADDSLVKPIARLQ